MRLQNVESGHRWLEKLEMTMMRLTSGRTPPDVVKTLLYRPSFFGRPFARLVQRALRGPSDWTVGEREVFASVISDANQCPFCETSHRAIAELALGKTFGSLPKNIYEDPNLSPKVKAMLPFLRKLTTTPQSLSALDIQPLRGAGISDQAIEDGICVCSLFSMINRLANTFKFELQDAEGLAISAKSLVKFGYKM